MSFKQGYEFDEMSRRPLYGAVTQELVDVLAAEPGAVVADVGCGSGLATELLLERSGDVASIVGIDPSEHELAIARRRIQDPKVRFVQGHAQDVAELTGPVDAAVLSNVMHQIPADERGAVVAGCHRLLRDGGRLALNTLFYEGAVPAESRHFYARWLQATAKELKARGSALLRERPTRAVAMQNLTPWEHEELFERAGFTQIKAQEFTYGWTLEDWDALCGYSVFIEGATGVDDLDVGSAALRAALRTVFADPGLTEVPRGWLFVSGVK